MLLDRLVNKYEPVLYWGLAIGEDRFYKAPIDKQYELYRAVEDIEFMLEALNKDVLDLAEILDVDVDELECMMYMVSNRLSKELHELLMEDEVEKQIEELTQEEEWLAIMTEDEYELEDEDFDFEDEDGLAYW